MNTNKKMKKIADRIKNKRLELCMSYQDLADKTGLSKSTLQRYETGSIKNIPIDKVEVLAKALNEDVSYIMLGSLRSIIEDRSEELNMTLEQLSDKSNTPLTFFNNLDNIQPDDGDYKYIPQIAKVLGIQPSVLISAFARQEPPAYDGENISAFQAFSDLTKEDKDQTKNEIDTIAAHLDGKDLTPQKMKLLEKYIDALFDED